MVDNAPVVSSAISLLLRHFCQHAEVVKTFKQIQLLVSEEEHNNYQAIRGALETLRVVTENKVFFLPGYFFLNYNNFFFNYKIAKKKSDRAYSRRGTMPSRHRRSSSVDKSDFDAEDQKPELRPPMYQRKRRNSAPRLSALNLFEGMQLPAKTGSQDTIIEKTLSFDYMATILALRRLCKSLDATSTSSSATPKGQTNSGRTTPSAESPPSTPPVNKLHPKLPLISGVRSIQTSNPVLNIQTTAANVSGPSTPGTTQSPAAPLTASANPSGIYMFRSF